MAAFPLSFLLSFLILQSPLFSTANPLKPHLTVSENLSQQHPISDPPLTFFEVTKPIKHPKTKPCSSLILQHDFSYTYNKPPVTAPYKPSLQLPISQLLQNHPRMESNLQRKAIRPHFRHLVRWGRDSSLLHCRTDLLWHWKILDGKRHKFGFGVTDALDEWFVDANLHLWLDFESKKTKGKLIKYKASPCKRSLLSKFKGLDGSFLTLASRSISSVGWVESSHGKVFSHSIQRFDYMNSMTFEKNGNLQVVNQTINSNRDIYVILSSSDVFSTQVFQRFFIYLNSNTVDEVEDNYTSLANLKLGFNEEKFSGGWFGFSFSSLQNSQDGQGYMLVKGHIVRSGLGSTQQVYIYDSTDGCYFRNVSSSNYTILHDESRGLCSREPQFELAFGLGGRLPLVPRRIALASDVYKERVRIS
ncbi:peptide-N4-N-acetyl-beta-glucosaminylasparagine amidase A [Cinnamomum micranthum f. kanehirae]|uniref:Peptide-N4-N-acetyl-beta-glucosaminylasparagine amidase A n=1 Tax=Cinnamomum micranthum f. kanehirae TaxID=337451 RepID=A0A3S3N6S8_9MAGN|nr:peptide-N4-N-acetyl-beta-glucosaminylasparagine amidase A [Cinnamomum micranthum f. kanehirae]